MAWRTTWSGDAALAATARAAVDRYSENFDPRVGVFFQVPGVNRAVIDTGLNLLPFYWAAGDDPTRQEIAVRHNATLLAAGIVRPEGSTYQAIKFDLATANRPAVGTCRATRTNRPGRAGSPGRCTTPLGAHERHLQPTSGGC